MQMNPEDPDTLEMARALGFTTVIVHHERGGEAQQRFARRVRRAAAASDGLLVPIAHSREMTAYALSPERSESPQ